MLLNTHYISTDYNNRAGCHFFMKKTVYWYTVFFMNLIKRLGSWLFQEKDRILVYGLFHEVNRPSWLLTFQEKDRISVYCFFRIFIDNKSLQN